MPDYPQKSQLSEAVNQNMQPPMGSGQPQGQPGSQQAVQPEDQSGQPGQGISPEEQVQYEQLMDNISIMVDGEEGRTEAHDKIMDMMDQDKGSPGDALTNALFSIGETIINQSEQQGIQLTDSMMMSAAMDTIMMLSELASEAGFFEATDEDIANGYAGALTKFMQNHPDLVDWEGLQAEMDNLDPQAVESAQTMFNAEPVPEGQEQQAGAPPGVPQQPPGQQPAPPQGIIAGA